MTLAASASAAAFYLKDTKSETLALTASASGLTSATISVTVASGSASVLKWTGASSASAGACSTLTTSTEDAYGNSANVGSATTVTYSASGTGGFYSDGSCGTGVTTRSISSGSASVVLYAKDTAVESLTLSASSGGFSAASRTLAISAGTPSDISYAGSSTITAVSCAAYVATLKDAYGNTATAAASTVITLGGAGAGTYYTASNCTGASSTITLASGGSTNTAYFKDTTPQTVTLSAASGSLNSGTKVVTVTAGPPYSLTLTGAVTSVSTGLCGGSFTVATKDEVGNASNVSSDTSVTLAGGSGRFYSDQHCFIPLPTATISNGSSSAGSIYYRDNAIESATLTASSGTLVSGTKAVGVVSTRQVMAGTRNTCVIFADNRLKCWGRGIYGINGIGSIADISDQAAEVGANIAFANLGTNRTVLKIQLGRYNGGTHACALLDNEQVKCWGFSAAGQTGLGDNRARGDGANEMGDCLPALDFGTNRTARDVSLTADISCATLDNMTVKCWGTNANGELGLGDTITRGRDPGTHPGAYSAISLGTNRFAVRAWGGADTACAEFNDGKFKCWGNYQNLGFGGNANNSRGDEANEMGDCLPFLDFGTNAVVVKFDRAESACALLSTGVLKCFGVGTNGRNGRENTIIIGDNNGEIGDGMPAALLGTNRTAKDFSTGQYGSCAILDTNQVKCWGYNLSGETGLGDNGNWSRGDAAGEMGDSLATINLGTNRHALAITRGEVNVCARLDDWTFKCWGNNGGGQLGLGDQIGRGSAPGDMGDCLPAINVGE